MEKRASVYFILKKKKNKKEKAGPHPSERLVTRTAGKLQRADSHHGGKALGRARCEPGTHTLQAPPHAPLAGRCSSTRTTGRAWPLGPPLGGSPSVGKCLILAHPHILCRPPPQPCFLQTPNALENQAAPRALTPSRGPERKLQSRSRVPEELVCRGRGRQAGALGPCPLSSQLPAPHLRGGFGHNTGRLQDVSGF